MQRLPERTSATLAIKGHLERTKGDRGQPKQTLIEHINHFSDEYERSRQRFETNKQTERELTENGYQ